MIQIPGYRVVREIASGSSGTVYLAIHANLDRQVALKVLTPGPSSLPRRAPNCS